MILLTAAGLTWFYSRQPHTRCPPPTEPHKYPWLSALFSGRVPLPLSTSHPQIHRRTHTHTVREITGKKNQSPKVKCSHFFTVHPHVFFFFGLNPEQYEASSFLPWQLTSQSSLSSHIITNTTDAVAPCAAVRRRRWGQGLSSSYTDLLSNCMSIKKIWVTANCIWYYNGLCS